MKYLKISLLAVLITGLGTLVAFTNKANETRKEKKQTTVKQDIKPKVFDDAFIYNGNGITTQTNWTVNPLTPCTGTTDVCGASIPADGVETVQGHLRPTADALSAINTFVTGHSGAFTNPSTVHVGPTPGGYDLLLYFQD